MPDNTRETGAQAQVFARLLAASCSEGSLRWRWRDREIEEGVFIKFNKKNSLLLGSTIRFITAGSWMRDQSKNLIPLSTPG